MTRILVGVAAVPLTVAAVVWRARAALLEAVGAALLVAAAVTVTPALGLFVAGVALVAKSAELDRRSRQ